MIGVAFTTGAEWGLLKAEPAPLDAMPVVENVTSATATLTIEFNTQMFPHPPRGTYTFVVELMGVKSAMQSFTLPDHVQNITILRPAVPDAFQHNTTTIRVMEAAFDAALLQVPFCLI